jgi:pyruvate dehydrogenase E2 component (dihydrolipoamide acetyltransferase)
MAIELTMPAVSPTMETGTLSRWLVKAGDSVRPGDIIAEIETDKATSEYAAAEAGVIAAILVPEGSEDVLVGTVIATLAPAGTKDAAPAPPAPDATVVLPAPPTAPVVAPASPVPALAFANDTQDATPLARRLAWARGVSVAGIAGSGAHGRVTRADIGLSSLLVFPANVPAPAAPVPSGPAPDDPPPPGVPVQTVKLSTMRRTIARRLSGSKQTVPHFYLTVRCNLDPLNRLRAELNAALAERDIRLSVNDMLLKVMALAMTAVPDVNVQFGGDVLHRFGRADIAMAVAVEGGLVTPVIRGVGELSLSAIAQESRALAAKAREGRLLPEDYQGGTASISNLGMFGIDDMVPVINPPQALILGVAAGIPQPWNVEGEMQLATIMAATASFDHRAIDGAAAAQFMARLRELIETPRLILC